MDKLGQVSVRMVMTQPAGIMSNELGRLQEEICSKDKVIDTQAADNKKLKEIDKLKMAAYLVADKSVLLIYATCVAAFFTIGYAVWAG